MGSATEISWIAPASAEELASVLREAAEADQTIRLAGAGSKGAFGGPVGPADQNVTTKGLNRLLQYEPNDLTISVEAGMLWRELEALLDKNGQMIPLDPWHEASTVGGVVAANVSGPRRRLYGTARDLVIGMRFATLEGTSVTSGGMVVKNVAGLDMAKLMIGSFGTLAALTSVNFKLTPKPEASRTFVFEFPSVEDAARWVGERLRGQLQPAAIDVHKDPTGKRVRVVVQALGSAAVVARFERDLPAGQGLSGSEEAGLWKTVRGIPNSGFAVVRVSSPIGEVGMVLAALPGEALARAGNGVTYGLFTGWRDALDWMRACRWPVVMETAGADCPTDAWWPKPTESIKTMQNIKQLFDPKGLLNRGRLHGRI